MFKNPDQLHNYLSGYDRDQATQIAKASLDDPLKWFCPNGAQDQFIQAVGKAPESSKIPIILFTAGNGIGKTTITVHTILNMVYGAQNGWYDYDLFHNFPYPKVIWYCSTGETIKNTVVPELERLLKPDTYDSFKDGKPHTSRISFINGWNIVFKTYDQDPSTYESANVGCIVADEPMPETLWKAVKSRRRMGCVSLLPMTPLYTPPYILDEITQSVERELPGYFQIKASVYEACKERGSRGHLDKDIIDEMIRSYDPEERQARAYGEFTYFSGLIYPDLDRDVHFVNPEEYPIPKFSRIMQIVDPHDSRLSACIWCALTPEGRYIVFAESPRNHEQQYWEMKRPLSIHEEVKEWIDIEKSFAYPVTTRIMDRIFGWQNRGQRTLSEMYLKESEKFEEKFAYMPSYHAQGQEGEIQLGHKLVRRQMMPLEADNKPGLVIWNNCYHTWQGLTHYIRKHETTKLAGDKGSGEGKIIQKYKDFPDVIRFMVGSQLKAQPPKSKLSKRAREWMDFVNWKNPRKKSNSNENDWQRQ